MNTLDKIKVMNAFTDGKEVHQKAINAPESSWRPVKSPSWNWDKNVYRIKPSAKSIIKELVKEHHINTFNFSMTTDEHRITGNPIIIIPNKMRRFLLETLPLGSKVSFMLIPTNDFTEDLMSNYNKSGTELD